MAVWRSLRHLTRLLREVMGFAWHNRAWWIVPVVLMMLLLAFLIVVSSSVTPFIYTVF